MRRTSFSGSNRVGFPPSSFSPPPGSGAPSCSLRGSAGGGGVSRGEGAGGLVSGVGALVMLTRRLRVGARVLAVAAVGSLVLAWGVAQWEYLLPESLTVSAAAAPSGTIVAVLVATGLAVLLVVPAFVLLYVLDQKDLLP